MGKTRRVVAVALILVVVSGLVLILRWHLLGEELFGPRGSSTWEVTLEASGELTDKGASLVLLPALDFRHQHIYGESFESRELRPRIVHERESRRREVVWRRVSVEERQPFRLSYTFRCSLGLRPATRGLERLTQELDWPPLRGAI